MKFDEAIRSGFRQYATFSGRASRSEYWYWVLFIVIASVAANIVDASLDTGVFGALVGLALFVPNLAVAIRRLHDIGKSAWNILWALIPLLGTIYLIYLYVQPSQPGTNAYGPPPTGNASAAMV